MAFAKDSSLGKYKVVNTKLCNKKIKDNRRSSLYTNGCEIICVYCELYFKDNSQRP